MAGAGIAWQKIAEMAQADAHHYSNMIQRGRERKEGARQFDLSHGLSREQWDFQRNLMEEQEARKRRIRNMLLGIGKTKMPSMSGGN